MPEFKYDHIIVRYGELSTKGKNRKEFTKQLTHNIKKRLLDFDKLEYRTLHDGLFIKLNDEPYEEIKTCLKDVFGYSSFSGAIISTKDIEDIKSTALAIVNRKQYKSFKVVTKRHDKSYPMISDEINRAVASHILHNCDIKVDVHNPELTIYVSIDYKEAYLMDEKVRGLGGFPVGINGKALVMMSGGIDSPVACFKTMKRGMRVECIHFASMPYTSVQALEKVKTLIKKLSVYQENIILHVIPFTELQLAIYEHCDESYAITIMRRMMYRIADRICRDRKIIFISNGESLGQVASQTPESMSVISKVSETLILRPLIVEDKLEIIDMAKELDTYETSILPYEDCCTIFDPKNPVTKPKEDKCLYYESTFDYNELIDKCIENDEIIKISYRDGGNDESIF